MLPSAGGYDVNFSKPMSSRWCDAQLMLRQLLKLLNSHCIPVHTSSSTLQQFAHWHLASSFFSPSEGGFLLVDLWNSMFHSDLIDRYSVADGLIVLCEAKAFEA